LEDDKIVHTHEVHNIVERVEGISFFYTLEYKDKMYRDKTL